MHRGRVADDALDAEACIEPLLEHHVLALELLLLKRAGDAHLEEWPATLQALRALKAEALVPGRGEAMKGNAQVNKALDYTQRWVETLFRCAKEAAAANMDLKAAMAHTRKAMDPIFGHVFIYEHCLPFDVSRAYDEARGIKNPRIWTAERDKEMWASLQD